MYTQYLLQKLDSGRFWGDVGSGIVFNNGLVEGEDSSSFGERKAGIREERNVRGISSQISQQRKGVHIKDQLKGSSTWDLELAF